VKVFYTRWVKGGMAPLFCILINPKYRDDAGLMAHERHHIAQQRRDGRARWLWRYLTSRDWRLRYEVEAYRVQIAFYGPGRPIDWAARYLAKDYGLGITTEQAREALSDPNSLHKETS